MTVTIRPRRHEDLPALAALLVWVHESNGYPVEGVADPEGWLRHNRELQSWTAVKDTEPIGQITLTHGTPDDDAARVWRERTGGEAEGMAIPVRLFGIADITHRYGEGITERAAVYSLPQSYRPQATE